MAIKSGIDASKVENLNGINFRMWKWKISYVLTHEKLLYTLNFIKLELDGQRDEEVVKKQKKKLRWFERKTSKSKDNCSHR